MKINLFKFENEINPVIVERGKDYFDDDSVKRLKQQKSGEWIAFVEGTETYKVCIILNGNKVFSYACTCPYDMGPVCKHIVAVLFALRNPAKKKSPEKTFEEIIKHIPRKDLNTILIDYAEKDFGFEEYILDMSTIKDKSSDKKDYRKIIKNTIKDARNRKGYIGYRETMQAVGGAEMVLDKAQEFLEKEQYSKALSIFQVVLEEMLPLLQEGDDSSGVIGDTIRQSLEGLTDCANQSKNKEFRKDLFDYLIKECGNKRYEGWSGMSWEILSITGDMVQSFKDRERLFNRINEIEKNCKSQGSWFNYDHEQATAIKMDVIERLGDNQEAEEFLSQNLDCTSLRDQAIVRAIKQKDYELAKKLALDGWKQDKGRGLWGLVIKWNMHLLAIAEKQKDIKEIKKYALQLFLDRNDFIYYDKYKKCFSVKEWSCEVQKIIDIIMKSKDGHNYAICLPQIYIREKKLKDLLAYVQNSNSASALEDFTNDLFPHFPAELAKIYEKVIYEELSPPMGRENYKYLCKFIKRFHKLIDDKDRTRQIVIKISETYKNRPAMLEELNKVV